MSDHNITYLTDVSLLTCVVQSGFGFSEVILKAARDVGATAGAFSHRARGIGARERLGILGIAVEADKEVISIMVSSEQRDLVYDTLYRAVDLSVPGRGFIYITPLEKASTYIPKSMMEKLDNNGQDGGHA
ncbi:MAG: P-II family nitrogen regulator [Gammaproteobacteria bacterium]|nr:P-II family nitrogen regulator [Gammaproteobacteria bacterium]